MTGTLSTFTTEPKRSSLRSSVQNAPTSRSHSHHSKGASPGLSAKAGVKAACVVVVKNMRLLLKALNDAQPLLCEALEHSADASGDPCCTSSPEGTSDRTGGTRESADAEGTHCKLCEVASETSKSKLMEKLLCDNAETQGKHACVDGSCESYGFARLWSKALRPLIVDDTTITEKIRRTVLYLDPSLIRMRIGISP